MNANRYFNFRYYYKTETGEEGFSNINIESLSFPSQKFLINAAGQKVMQVYEISAEQVSIISIQGWNEFRNKKDYDNFIKRK